MPRSSQAFARPPHEPASSGGHGDAARRRWLEWSVGVPFTEGNAVTVLQNGDEIFPAMLEAIHGAERSVEFVTYVYWTGEVAKDFAAALCRAARRGVEVRVVLDSFGAAPMRRELLDDLREAGVHLEWFRRFRLGGLWRSTHRTHRKLLIVDHRVAFTGGVGIAAEWQGRARGPHEWRDLHFRFEGPVVAGLWAGFAGEWLETCGVLPSNCQPPPELPPAGGVSLQVVRATSSVGWSDIATVFHALFMQARERIWISTAYFIPDKQTIAVLEEKARHGVDVQIMTPGRHADHRIVDLASHVILRRIVDREIRVFRYQKTMFHTKAIVVDDDLACIGSANLNHRSQRKDDEVVVIASDRALVRTLADIYEGDRVCCDEVTRERLAGRPWWHKVFSRFSFRMRSEF